MLNFVRNRTFIKGNTEIGFLFLVDFAALSLYLNPVRDEIIASLQHCSHPGFLSQDLWVKKLIMS